MSLTSPWGHFPFLEGVFLNRRTKAPRTAAATHFYRPLNHAPYQHANANCGPRSSNFFCSRFGPCSKKKWVGSVMLFRSRHGHRCIHDSSRCGSVHLFHFGWKSALLPFWIPVREFFPPDLPILSRQCQYDNPMGLGLLRSQYANGCKRISDELW